MKGKPVRRLAINPGGYDAVMTAAQPLSIAIDGTQQVSALLLAPTNARAAYVFAHGAGAGMAHPFMSAASEALAQRGIATLRYNFAYMERRTKRVDSPPAAHAAVRAAVAKAREVLPDLPLFAGGKSFGGRMTSQAQAHVPLPGVGGLIFFGFPLHPPGKPSDERAAHLADVRVPMLFLQGTRDEFARLDLLQRMVHGLGDRATLRLFQGADHSFRMPRGKPPVASPDELAAALAGWVTEPSLQGGG